MTVLTGMGGDGGDGSEQAVFDVIDVERINIVEPDGTLRLVLSSKARFPGLILRGEEYEHPNRNTGGMLFFNDEGTETGGLIFGGAKDENGEVSSFGHLSFDKYEQDQVVTFNTSQSGDLVKGGVSVWDRPDWSMVELMQLLEETPETERDSTLSAFFGSRDSAEPRLYLGKSQDGSVSLRLNDAEGRERLVVEVSAEGAAVLRFLDENGEETARFPAAETTGG